MLNLPSLSISICLIFHFLVPVTNSNILMTRLHDIINSTCKQCTEKSSILNYKFCVTALQPIPVSHAANLEGLGIVAMELALQNATSTVTTIEKMLNNKTYDPFAVNCLMDCLELYGDAASLLVTSIGSFLSSRFDAANVLMSAVMETVATCEDGFTEKKGEVSPLIKENHNLFEISSIALCIINLVSAEFPALSTSTWMK